VHSFETRSRGFCRGPAPSFPLRIKLYKKNINLALAFHFRVRAHAASALTKFCEGVEQDTLLPYLGPIVGRLLTLLLADNGPLSTGKTVRHTIKVFCRPLRLLGSTCFSFFSRLL
jgi:hypothetical protein